MRLIQTLNCVTHIFKYTNVCTSSLHANKEEDAKTNILC
jgi:hypothetical protein